MIGKQISQYVIESELGRGGMGVVYKASDTSLDRTVALKFLPPMLTSDESVEARFINEAKSVSALDHPNIAIVHEIGRTDDGHLFIVMAYYDGSTLEDRIEEGPIELEEAIDFSIQIASGLEIAHESGIVHRDIKPGNVIVTDRGTAKILDFGLAKVQNVNLTIGGQSLGTLAYMSPEQAQGRDLDHRTDLWALGVVMYEMITGKRPFDGPYDAAILYSAANEAHEAPSTWRSDIPEHIEAVINGLLEKDPDKRLKSATEVVALLKGEQHSASSAPAPPVAVSEPDSPEVDGENEVAVTKTKTSSPKSVTINLDTAPIARRPWILITAVLAVSALILLWVVGMPGAQRSEEDRIAARGFVEAGIEHQNSRNFSLAEAEYERAIDRDPDLWSAWTSYASLKNAMGEYDLAIEYARNAINLNENDAVAFFNLGIGLVDSGNATEALDAFSSAVALDGAFTLAYSAWGNTLLGAGEHEEAINVLKRGQDAAPNDPYVFLIYKNLGMTYAAMSQTDDSILYLESSLSIQSRQTDVLVELATQYEQKGDRATAVTHWNSVLEHETDPAKRRDAQSNIERLSN